MSSHNYPVKPVLFMDCDHTIRCPDSNKTQSQFINVIEHHQMMEDILNPILTWLLTHDTNFIGLVSNQGGVASNIVPLQFVLNLSERTKNDLYHLLKPKYGLPPNHIINVCAPFGGWLRKPNLGMYAVVQWEMSKLGYDIDVENSVMVGDLESDKEAAKNAKIPFVWAHEFFGRETPERLKPKLAPLPGDMHDNLLG